MPKKDKKISPAEWEVMEIVWSRGEPGTAAEIYETLDRKVKSHPKTVNTFLTRLVEKKILGVHREGKANVYVPLFTREQCVGKSFLERIFRGAMGPLLAHFCERADLTDEEIAELQKLLQQRTGKGRKK
ncbi:MAG TPA: BlaI/MecI/CopY family transcriptional regulator [Chthoniobacteraceae bacterium]|nr:BlaI/MecI/CopY family transcriptional regulator [Chthoniobacteraceae bacterium]